MCGQKCQEGLLIRLYSLSLLLCFSLSLSCPYPLSFLTSSPHLPSSSTPEAGGHQPGAAFAVGLKERRQRMRPGLRSVSHTHTHTRCHLGGVPVIISPPLSLLRSVSHTHSLSFGGVPVIISPPLSPPVSITHSLTVIWGASLSLYHPLSLFRPSLQTSSRGMSLLLQHTQS